MNSSAISKKKQIWSSPGIYAFCLMWGFIILMISLSYLFGKLPFYLGWFLFFLYFFLCIKLFIDLLLFRHRYGSDKIKMEQILFPFTLMTVDLEKKGFSLKYGELFFYIMIYRLVWPLIVFFFGRRFAFFVWKKNGLLFDKKKAISEPVVDFLKEKSSKAHYITFSFISNVLLPLFLALLWLIFTLFSVWDEKLVKLSFLFDLDKLMHPIIQGKYYYPDEISKFECKGLMNIADTEINEIQRQCFEQNKGTEILSLKLETLRKELNGKERHLDEIFELSNIINSGNPLSHWDKTFELTDDVLWGKLSECSRSTIHKKIDYEIQKIDPKVEKRNTGYSSQSSISNSWIAAFQINTTIWTGSNMSVFKNLRCEPYDIDKYLSDKTTTLIAVALLLVVFGFFLSVLVFVIVITYLNIGIYLDRRYYNYLLDIEIIEKLK